MKGTDKAHQYCLIQVIKRILRKKKLAEMDWIWHRIYGNCLGDFPPSFYQTHTKKEILEIKEQERKKREELLGEMEKKSFNK